VAFKAAINHVYRVIVRTPEKRSDVEFPPHAGHIAPAATNDAA
jgi:hypothetical protein